MLKKNNSPTASKTDEDNELLLKAASTVSPVSELNEANRATLCRTAKVVHVQRNDQLQPEASNRWMMFLVEGSLQLFNGKEEVGSIATNSKEALQPLFLDKTAYTMAKTSAFAKVVKFGREQMSILSSEQQKNAIHVVDVQITELDNLVLDDIISTVKQNKMQLATYSESARNILMKVPSINGAQELDEIIHTDPGLAAHLLRLSNQTDAGVSEAAHSIRGVISRMGIGETKLTMIDLLKNNTIVPANEFIAERYQRYIQRTRLSAAIAGVLASKVPHLKSEQATLIAMMADIGELLVITHANKFAEQITSSDALSDMVQNLRPVMNGWVLSNWDFPSDYIDAGNIARDWYRNHTGEISYSDLVTASLLVIQSEMPKAVHSSIPAADNLLLARRMEQVGIDLRSPADIFKQATNKIVHAQQVLKAA